MNLTVKSLLASTKGHDLSRGHDPFRVIRRGISQSGLKTRNPVNGTSLRIRSPGKTRNVIETLPR